MAYPVDNTCVARRKYVLCECCAPGGKKSKSLSRSYLFMAIVPMIDSLEREDSLLLQNHEANMIGNAIKREE